MTDSTLRQLPAVHRLLTEDLVQRHGERRVTCAARALLDELRRARPEPMPSLAELQTKLRDRLRPALVPLINATGVLLHTNLGRAPWSEAARQAALAAASYTGVELDLDSGRRGRRGAEVEARLTALTGAEAALVVNNGAAAVLLCLRELARGQRVLVSRGELVEIGGGFRIPEIIEESGATLQEVGTTNRTHLADFERALEPGVRVILRVHHSNFRQLGFVTQPSLGELKTLGLPIVVDAGSGALLDIGDEPNVLRQLEQGADVVCFSGDKLLGGPQAGLIVGRARFIDPMRKTPLLRALRPDKVTLAALAATLDDWLLQRPVPLRQMLEYSAQQLKAAVADWIEALPKSVHASLREVQGAIGGGSVPGRTYPSFALSITQPKPERLFRALLAQTPPVLGRLQHDSLLLDARSVVPLGQGALLMASLNAACKALEAP